MAAKKKKAAKKIGAGLGYIVKKRTPSQQRLHEVTRKKNKK